MSVSEPTIERLSNPLLRYFLATRPAFLMASIVPCLLGIACARFSGVPIDALSAIATLLGAALVHAGINVLNDYYDALAGTDEINVERIYPFTGGSRFIQNAVLTLGQTRTLGWVLLTGGAVLGLWLTYLAGAGLLAIGAAGLFIGWAYSAPPLALNSRGLGELCVALGFGVLIPVGAHYVQRGTFAVLPLLAGLPLGLLITDLLYINQFPDRLADQLSGKRHWVVRLGTRRARWVYLAVALAAYSALLAEVWVGRLPLLAMIALLPALLSVYAAVELLRYAADPGRLAPGIRMTLAAALSHGLLLSAALWWG